MTDRPDLGALLHELLQEVIRRELPLLQEESLDLWEYAVLSRLGTGAAATQAQLAAAVGRDATRIIPVLDRLQARDLVERTPDPRDRRNRVVSLTDGGRALLGACRAAVRAMEQDLLATVDPARAEVFRQVLERLARG